MSIENVFAFGAAVAMGIKARFTTHSAPSDIGPAKSQERWVGELFTPQQRASESDPVVRQRAWVDYLRT